MLKMVEIATNLKIVREKIIQAAAKRLPVSKIIFQFLTLTHALFLNFLLFVLLYTRFLGVSEKIFIVHH